MITDSEGTPLYFKKHLWLNTESCCLFVLKKYYWWYYGDTLSINFHIKFHKLKRRQHAKSPNQDTKLHFMANWRMHGILHFSFLDRVLERADWPQTWYRSQDDLELLTLLTLPLKCWVCTTTFDLCGAIASCIPGKHWQLSYSLSPSIIIFCFFHTRKMKLILYLCLEKEKFSSLSDPPQELEQYLLNEYEKQKLMVLCTGTAVISEVCGNRA